MSWGDEKHRADNWLSLHSVLKIKSMLKCLSELRLLEGQSSKQPVRNTELPSIVYAHNPTRIKKLTFLCKADLILLLDISVKLLQLSCPGHRKKGRPTKDQGINVQRALADTEISPDCQRKGNF